MNTLNKICTALTIVFAVSLVVLVAQILYVLLYRRRRFHNHTTGDVEFSSETSSFNPTTPWSKELLYFVCWKSQTSTRIEPDAESATSDAAAAAASVPALPTTSSNDADVDEMLKRHAMYGPSRVLFTIREEEREEIEMDLSSVEREENNKKNKRRKTMIRSVSLEDVSYITSITTADVVIDVVDDTTPFSTPCASPPYYTPSPSPSHERN